MKFSYPPYFAHDNEPAMWQNPYEFRMTIKFLESIETKSVLEIGTGYGLFAKFLREIDIKVKSIDSKPAGLPLNEDNIYIGDSTLNLASIWALNQSPGLYDVVYIDGGHDYRTCYHDYITYSKLARKAVMIHDIGGNQSGKYPVNVGPALVWKRIRWEERTMEIHDKSPFNCGVGICIIGGI